MRVTSAASERLSALVAGEQGRLEPRAAAILNTYARQLRERLGFLHVSADEYEQANRDWWDASVRLNAEVNAAFERHGSPAPATNVSLELEEEVGAAGELVYLRIETFHMHAKVLLDRLARLLPLYFDSGSDVGLNSHSRLVGGKERPNALPRFAEARGLSNVPESLAALIQELGASVSDYRDDLIVHDYNARRFRGIAFRLDTGEASILSSTVHPLRDSETSTQSETPRTLLPLIEQYVLELVDYLEQNRDKAAKQTAS